MRKQLIDSIQIAIDSKKEIFDGISSIEIRSLIKAFLYVPDKLKTIEFLDISWSVEQYFSRKYGI